LVWLGDEATEIGLIDGLGDIGYVKRDILKQTNTRVYEAEKSLLEQFMGDFAAQTATQLGLYLNSLK